MDMEEDEQIMFLPPVKTPQKQPAGVRGDGVLHLVLFALLTGLEALREQGTQDFDYDPEHTGAEQNEDEHEHQHNGGGDKKLNHTCTSYQLNTEYD